MPPAPLDGLGAEVEGGGGLDVPDGEVEVVPLVAADTTFMESFMPEEQWPAVEQIKCIFPGLERVMVVLPSL